MSQSRFSIVLVGVSALLRRPLVSRLRPADGERSPWVVFAARGCRFDSGFRWASWFFRLPLRSGPRRVGLRAHCFRFSACTDSGWPLGEFVLPPSASEIPLGGLAFGLTASAFRRAPIRSGCWASWFFRLPFRRLPSAGWPSGSPLPLFGMHRFGDSARRVGLRAHRFRFSARTASEIAARWLAFGFTASAFRHAPFRKLPSAGWPSGSPLPLFGMRRSAPLHRRSEDRRSTPTRQLFHFKTLIPTC